MTFPGQVKPQLCGICGTKHSPHMPDNRTFVPCCPSCWNKISPNVRLMALVEARQEDTWRGLVQSIDCWLEGPFLDMIERKMESRQENELN